MENLPPAADDPSLPPKAATTPASTPIHVTYPGFWLRLVAACLDWIALQIGTWLVELVVLGALFWIRVLLRVGPAPTGFWETFDSMEAQVIEAVIYILLSVPYFVWATYRFGTTLGKRALRIYVVQARTLQPVTLRQSFVRWCSYLLSYLPVGAGFLMVAFHPEKRGLHDLIAGTQSIRRPSRWAASSEALAGNAAGAAS